MGFDRFAAKHSARESMRLNSPSPILVTLVYFLLTAVLSAAISYLLYDPIADLMDILLVLRVYDPEEIMGEAANVLQLIFDNHQQEPTCLYCVSCSFSM